MENDVGQKISHISLEARKEEKKQQQQQPTGWNEQNIGNEIEPWFFLLNRRQFDNILYTLPITTAAKSTNTNTNNEDVRKFPIKMNDLWMRIVKTKMENE